MRNEVLVTSCGDNDNVLATVNEVFVTYRDTCRDLVSGLWDYDFRSQCQSIFDYVLRNVAYIEDEGNNQWIKTPQRTVQDGYADCKSMSILAASCLWCLGVPEVRLRFVSFCDSPTYTHVYVVAGDGRETIVIDPVERVHGQPRFDYARRFVRNKDFIYRQ